MVQHHPQSAIWSPQPQNIPTAPTQPYVGQIHQPLVDINSPPVGGKYTLWIPEPIIGGKPPYVAPTLVTQGATIRKHGWKQLPPLFQPPNWGQGVVQNPWGNVQNIPMSYPFFQQVPQPYP